MGCERWSLVDDFARARDELVSDLVRDGYVRTPAVERAFRWVPRELFVPEDRHRAAYVDTPLPIGMGQTISAASMIAIMLEEADLQEGHKVLDVGTGSGYNAALLAEIVGPANVVSIERHASLLDVARDNLRRAGFDLTLVLGDGTLGFAPKAPYDRIVVTAGAPRVTKSWIRQTKVGGKIVAPVGRSTFSQVLVTATKTGEERVVTKEGTPCAFVPLVGQEGW